MKGGSKLESGSIAPGQNKTKVGLKADPLLSVAADGLRQNKTKVGLKGGS